MQSIFFVKLNKGKFSYIECENENDDNKCEDWFCKVIIEHKNISTTKKITKWINNLLLSWALAHVL